MPCKTLAEQNRLTHRRSRSQFAEPTSSNEILAAAGQTCGSGFGGFGFKSVLGDADKFGEGGVIRGGEIGEDLTIEFDLGSFESLHEAAVREAGGTRGSIDADLPEAAERTFLGPAVAISVLTAVIKGISRVAIELGAAHPEAFGGAECSFTTSPGGGGVGNSHDSAGVR
jgi:hypothetical protein